MYWLNIAESSSERHQYNYGKQVFWPQITPTQNAILDEFDYKPYISVRGPIPLFCQYIMDVLSGE
jgi:hypothetical protein